MRIRPVGTFAFGHSRNFWADANVHPQTDGAQVISSGKAHGFIIIDEIHHGCTRLCLNRADERVRIMYQEHLHDRAGLPQVCLPA